MDNFHHTSLPLHLNYLELWKDITSKTEDVNTIAHQEESSKLLGHYASINNQIITVYNMKSQKVLYVSDTYHTVSGYNCSIDEYKKWSSVFFLRDLPLAQSWFIIQTSIWFKTKMQSKIKKYTGKKSLQLYLHNFTLSPPESDRTHHLSLVVDTLEMAENGSPIIFLIVKKEVHSLIKEDAPWWAEFCFNGQERYHYHQSSKKHKPGSILSEREMEILTLIQKGLETKAIAEQLDLSVHTIDKHRKNMLEYTGAKDTSMLIQICKVAKIIS
jgi:DNA-binding CsgD family transcriptional regulator